MRKLVYHIGASLDGHIAGPGAEFDFYPLSDEMAASINSRYPETVPTHVRKLVGLDGVPNKVFDTVVMGRGTFEPARTSRHQSLLAPASVRRLQDVDDRRPGGGGGDGRRDRA
jgi:hypothetical protein